MGAIRDDARAFFWPTQVGVAIKSGAEKVVHAARRWHSRQGQTADRVALPMPSTQLTAPLSSAGLVNPSLALLGGLIGAMVHRPTCDLVPTNCLLRLACSKATRWGPCFFAVGLQPLAAEIRGLPGLDVSLFYLDDGLLAGEITAVTAALALIQQKAAALDLKLNLAKSEAIAVGHTDLSLVARTLPPDLVCDASGHSRITRDFEFLGATLGSDAFVASHTARRVATLKSLCACCAIVLALAALCTACAVSRRCPSNPPWKLDQKVRGCFTAEWPPLWC